jgi:hypothetical protein
VQLACAIVERRFIGIQLAEKDFFSASQLQFGARATGDHHALLFAARIGRAPKKGFVRPHALPARLAFGAPASAAATGPSASAPAPGEVTASAATTLLRTRFVHREAPSLKLLLVESLARRTALLVIGHLDKGKPA